MAHILACALYCNSDGSLNGLGTFMAWVFGILFGLAALIWVIKAIVKPSSMSPGTRSLLSGRNIPSYTAPVNAVTPGGVRVRQARCCAAGHQLPDQAVQHAAQIKSRIERTGR
jgi:hypothetical protein